MLRRLDEVGRITWATKLRILLCKYGFGNVWNSGGVGNEKLFIHIFKQRLFDCREEAIVVVAQFSGSEILSCLMNICAISITMSEFGLFIANKSMHE